MRPSLKVLGLGLALAGAGLFALHRARAQDGNPNAAGAWEGKVAFKDFSLDPGSSGDNGRIPATMTINQNGADLFLQLSVTTEEGVETFLLTGLIGNGHFWVFNGDTESPMVLSGHFGGSDQSLKMKGTGILASGSSVSEVKFNLRRTGVPTVR